jgi:drug/metabolite transporter (DMT)-like permease
MIVSALLWSIAGVVTRHLHSARGFEITFWRSLFAALTVVIYFAATKGRSGLTQLARSGTPVLVSGLMWAIMFTCFMVAMSLTRVANVLIVQSLSPVFTALLAAAVLRRPVSARTWAVIAVAATGIASMYIVDVAGLAGQHLLGVVVALGIPLAASVNWVNIQRVGHRLDLTGAVLLGGLLSAAITLPLAWPMRASTHDIALLALLGIVQLGIPCIVVVRAARLLAAHEAALLALLEVVFGILLVWWFAGERPGAATLIGGSMVLAALAYNELSRPATPTTEVVVT